MNRMTQRKKAYLHKSGEGHNIEHRFSALGQKYEKPTVEAPRLDSTADSEEREKFVFFYHPDHLNSTSFVTDIDGNAVQFVSYIPYGEVFVEERNTSFSSSYLFNAKELDNETGLYYYGARYLDPQSIMWLSVDPLWEKNVGVSPYSFCSGNPVNRVDPDGMEDIVVCGSQYDESAGNKLMFVNQGIRALKEMSVNNPGESRSMILFKEGYTDNQISEIRKSVSEFGGTLKMVDSANEMIDYINNKNGDRSSDRISNMEIYAHGLYGSIEFGYKTNKEDLYSFGKDNVGRINKMSFKGLNSNITSYACRTGLGVDASVFCINPETSKSFAQSIANATGANVYAFARRTSYAGTLGTSLDRHSWLSGIVPAGVLPVPLPTRKMVDGASFTPFGANRGVVGGDTPFGLSPFMYHLMP